MRRLIGTVPALVLATLLLAGCGDEESPVAQDPAPTDAPTEAPSDAPTDVPTDQPTTPDPSGSSGSSDTPTKSPPLTPGGTPYELLEIVSGTAGGGRATGEAVEIASQAHVDAFVADLSDTFAADVRAAVQANPAPEGQRLLAAVVALGCDVPPGVDVSAEGDDYTIVGTKVADPLPECFAPVTSVALVAVG